MREIFIELVPRSTAALRQSMTELEATEVPFQGYNIPELISAGQSFLRPEDVLQLRTDGVITPGKQLALHLRTRERSVQETVDRMLLAARNGVDIALLVTGDPVQGNEHHCTHAHEVIASYIPPSSMRVAVAADVYQENWGRWNKKTPAIGKTVDAVFTQPIFRPSALDAVRQRTQHLLKTNHVYTGIAWMTNERSRRYWHERNGVPLDHLPQGKTDAEIECNSIAQATDVLRAATQQGYSIYIMLMRNTVAQLQNIISQAENIGEI